MYGCGSYDNITSEDACREKASVSVSLAETTESVIGSSTPKDFETMMQLIYLRLAKPRFDSMAHNAIIARFEALLANMEKDPNKLKRDSIFPDSQGYHPRTRLLTKESVSGYRSMISGQFIATGLATQTNLCFLSW
jgi:zinc protease